MRDDRLTALSALLSPGRALAFALFATPPLSVYAPNAASLAAGIALVAVLLRAAAQRRAPALPGAGLAAVLGAIVAWGALSALWSVKPAESLERAALLAALFAGGALILAATEELTAQERRLVGWAALAGVLSAAAFATFEAETHLALRRLFEPDHHAGSAQFKRGATVLALFAWPAVLALLRHNRAWLAAGAYAAVGVAIALLASEAAKLAWAVGLVFAAAQFALPRAALRTAAVAAIAGVLLAPVIARGLPETTIENLEQRGLASSTAHRVVMWRYAAGLVAETPFLGRGLDASRNLPEARVWMVIGQTAPDAPLTAQLMPLHPHNAALQLWIELGAPGAVLGAGLLALAFAGMARAGARGAQACGLGLAGSALIVAMVSYGIWQSWWLAVLWLAAAGWSAAARVDPARQTGIDKGRA